MTTDPALPKNWAEGALGDLISLAIGGDWGKEPGSSDPEYVDVRCIRASEMRNWATEKGLTAALRAVKRTRLVGRELAAGDIIVEISGGGPEQPVGRTLLIDETCLATNPDVPKICTNFFRLMRPSRLIFSPYVNYFLQHFYTAKDISAYQGGSNNLRNLKFDKYLTIRIPLAPVSEQRRIVAKIDELFSELDKSVDSLERARQYQELYRHSLLNKAVCDATGELYPSKRLEDLIGTIGQGWSPKCDLNRPAGKDEWAIIKTTAVQPMAYRPHECKPLPDNLKPRPGIEIRDGDLLMTRKGPRPRTGVVCHVTNVRHQSMLCDTVYRFRALEEIVLPEYLEIALNSPRVVHEIDARKSGINESGISLNHGRILSLQVPVPEDKALQSRIVGFVKEKLSIVEHADIIIGEEIQKTAALRQAILHRAFTGRLVDQDKNDEPAIILLERIRAEREKEIAKIRRSNKNGKKEAA